ncbi:MAG TPA: selenocysteine-specific translation elongation factor [Acidimicrobiia bacterium]|nr:selenocysteine-specific translation elongation factor [Acidimicrobiia bacterium]
MPLIGTAGHVDHGKSTLVEALTGLDPDRWPEEKERGLTIDLGFAWTTMEPVGEVSFVDVPGHERFLKNMLAGIEAIDVALFVVAADEGWMPQSEEHLAVLDLLGIDSGVVALTKIDAVGPERADDAGREVARQLKGTTLHDAPILPVSARTGDGMERLREQLVARLSGVRHGGNRPRLWVDRAFSVRGAGTVVTGTLTEGPLSVGDDLMLLPVGKRTRIRGMQSHEKEIDVAGPGRRLALNLTGLDRSETLRGTMLGLPGQWELSARFSARLRAARYVDDLTRRGAFQVHLGSGAHPATIKRLEGGYALIEVPTALPIRTGDRFILRESGRRLVVAGGVVIDPAPGPPARAIRTAQVIDPLGEKDDVATALLALRGMDDVGRLAAHSGGGTPRDSVLVGRTALTSEQFDDLRSQAETMVSAHHDQHPLRPGIPLATLATNLGISGELAERLVSDSEEIERSGPDVSARHRHLSLDPDSRLRWDRARALLGEGLAVPHSEELGLGRELTHLLIRDGLVVRVSDDLVYLPEQIGEIKHLLSEMTEPFTVADFRDRSGLSRKYAVPILEWADREGLTIRRGDVRHLR